MISRNNSDSETTLRVGPLVNLAPLMLSLGVDPEPVFRACGFSPDAFADPDQRVAFVHTSSLLQHCVAATGCEHLGLKLGQRAGPSHLGIAGFLLRVAPTVETALHAMIENLDLHDEGGGAELIVGPQYSTLSYRLHQPGTVAIEQIYDLSAAMMYQIMRMLCGGDWKAENISMARRSPNDCKPYQRYFKTLLYFDATECGITFSNHWLQQIPPAADTLLYQHLEKEAVRLHGIHDLRLTEVLPAVFRRALLAGQLSTADVARELGIHERTLHRRLSEEGTSFRQQLDSARRRAGEELLGTTSLPVCDVASALGYADASSFIRAFQRWSGTSPSTWRRQHLTLKNNQGSANCDESTAPLSPS